MMSVVPRQVRLYNIYIDNAVRTIYLCTSKCFFFSVVGAILASLFTIGSA
jgi:hypothetical protein